MAQPKGFPKEKNIIRIDGQRGAGRSGAHGWRVKFSLGGKETSKLFSDNTYGGMEAAYEAARNFRDSFLLDWHAVISKDKADIYIGNIKKVTGVTFIRGDKKANSDEYSSYWLAQWVTGPNRERGQKAYFVATHGYEKAYELAVQARLEATGEVIEEIRPKLTFTTPEDPDIKIWRYLDFTKFVSMLEKKSLFFSFIAFMNDPFEGSLSALNKSLRLSLFEKKFFDEDKINRLKLRERVAVNSWHMNTQESAAMWKLYAKSDEAVCIQSTFSLLREELPPLFRITQVKYVDYNSNYIPEYHTLSPFVFKRKSFEHEQELRALIDIEDADSRLYEFFGIEQADQGIHKAVSIERMIQTVYVAPESPDWFYELVKSVCKTYNLSKIPVVRSSLETEPFY